MQSIEVLSNMNEGGIPYVISNPSSHGKYSTEFSDESPEYFDVYGQIQTRYSQVYWILNDPIPLPSDIVKRFAGKVMAITGYEADQVIKTTEGEVSFPIYKAYNHHYFAWLTGADSEMVYLPKAKLLPNPTHWEARSLPNNHGFPTNLVFKENPGGEYRKSYHGYPKGYAQLIYSPTTWLIEPMQIDTHNRDYNGTGFQPWFLPKQDFNKTDPKSHLSPLIECPCTDRIGRVVINNSAILTSGLCTATISSASECFKAIANIATVFSTSTVNNFSLPYGCIIEPLLDGASYNAIFNTANSTQPCGTNAPLPILSGKQVSLIDISIAVHTEVPSVTTITLSGPATVWFGVGFNAGQMADLPYAIIVDGNGEVSERKLADHGAGTVLNTTVTVVSNTVISGVRTVVLSRSTLINSLDYYAFPTQPATIAFINAIGNTATLAYHQSRTAAELTLLPTSSIACMCAPVETTYLSYMNTSLNEYNVYCAPEPRGDMLQQNNPACKMQTYMGGTSCCKHTWFLTDRDQENLIPSAVDTYFIKFRYYFQEYVPATPKTAASHQMLHHWVFLIDEQVNDYEEVQCADGSMCQGVITARLKASDMGIEAAPANYTGFQLFVIAAHCHAPSCIRQELYNADTGELLCRTTALYGNGTEAFNEAGYEALPPCLYGYQPGLMPPPTISKDTNIMAIKVFNNTYRHLGQMAQWTGLLTYTPYNPNGDSE